MSDPAGDYQLLVRTLITQFPLCGCGSTSKNWAIVRSFLERAEDKSEGRPSFYAPMPEHDLSATAVEFIAQMISEMSAPPIEHGTSIGYSWLTSAGEMLLVFLRGNPDADEWPEWATGSSGDAQFSITDPREVEVLAYRLFAEQSARAPGDVTTIEEGNETR